jgi:hypothetical protein
VPVAFLSNTALSSRRTPTPDLDVVVVLDGPPAPYRETVRAHGWIVELFVHSKESLPLFYGFDAQTRTCTLARMCADGYVLRDVHDEAANLQLQARAVIDAGPTALSDEDRLKYRCALTDLLDDFRGSDDQVEIIFIAGQLLAMARDFALISERRWTDVGKWLALPRQISGCKSVAVAGNDEPRAKVENLLAGLFELRLVRCQRVDRRSFARPPEMGTDDKPLRGLNQGRDVLRRMTRGIEQRHRWCAFNDVSAVTPDVILVDGPHIVKTSIPKEGSVESVIGMMMTEDHVRDVILFNTEGV